MAGGYIVTSLMKNQGVPFPLALIGATLTVAAASVPIERLLYRRFYGGDDLDQVLLTIGLVFMSVASATYIWGPLQQPLQPPVWLSTLKLLRIAANGLRSSWASVAINSSLRLSDSRSALGRPYGAGCPDRVGPGA